MPLIVFGLVWIVAATIHTLSLRPGGGWSRLYESKREANRGNPQLWSELTTIERTWLYGVPASFAFGLCCVIAGILLVAIG
jgi:hypothetical protein